MVSHDSWHITTYAYEGVKMEKHEVLRRYGEVPLQVVDYCDGGFQLESVLTRDGRKVYVSFTPYNLLQVYVSHGCNVNHLVKYSGSIWVTIKSVVSTEFDDEVCAEDAEKEASCLRLVCA